MYSRAKTKAEGNTDSKDGFTRTDVDYAWNGFIGHIKGWTLESNKDLIPPFNKDSLPEWVYFGSVPYGLGAQAIPIADNGSTFLAPPATKPEGDAGDDNTAALYLREVGVHTPSTNRRWIYPVLNIALNTGAITPILRPVRTILR